MTTWSYEESEANRPVSVRLPDIDLRVRRPADRATVVAIIVAGALFDLAIRSGINGVAGALVIAAAGIGLVATGRVQGRQAQGLAVLAVVFGAFVALRASEWLLAPDVAVAAGLLVLSASLGGQGSVLDLTIPSLVLRALTAAYHGLAAPAFLRSATKTRSAGGEAKAGLVRGVMLAAPVVVLLTILLASADAVFASLFRLPGGPEQLVLHAGLIVVGGWGMTGLLRTASAAPAATTQEPTTSTGPRLGRTETTVVLGAVVTLFAVFAVTQLVAAAGGADHVLQQRGLTYAEYARSGYFQLPAVAALTMGTLLVLRSVADVRGPTLLLMEATIALTLVIVGTALHRLSLYEHAYGLTMLRLYAQVFAVWIALIFVLLATLLAGVGRPRNNWLPAAAGAAGLALLLMLNLVNPEALVVHRNVARDKVDSYYLQTLSDDAVPALVEAGLDEVGCPQTHYKGWAAANWSNHRADRARTKAKRFAECPNTRQP